MLSNPLQLLQQFVSFSVNQHLQFLASTYEMGPSSIEGSSSPWNNAITLHGSHHHVSMDQCHNLHGPHHRKSSWTPTYPTRTINRGLPIFKALAHTSSPPSLSHSYLQDKWIHLSHFSHTFHPVNWPLQPCT